ncbi:MAG: Eco57I restriction-modification methylase domain-containing protein [Segetibacter sp.]
MYGVDIDRNAVEVTKLSLLLKCMEGETTASINTQMTFFHERVLPSLEKNIKCGNSLIDLDYYDGEMDFGDERKIKPFNWEKAFPEVFKINKLSLNEELRLHNKRILKQAEEAKERANQLIKAIHNKVEEPEAFYGERGGFDVAIGNPPYVMLQNLEKREVFDYALRKFNCAKYKIDTYQLFIEQSVKLLKKNGLLGFITPNTFLKNIHSEPLRKFILDNAIIREILLLIIPFFYRQVSILVFLFLKKRSPHKKVN